MSYSSNIKDTIINEPYKNVCCRRSFLLGVASTKWKYIDNKISFTLEKDEYCQFVLPLILEFFGKEAIVSRPEKGGRCRVVSFFSKSAYRYINDISLGGDFYTSRCQMCMQAFFRGVFFASGRISDPRKQYLIEFSPINYPDRLLELFSSLDIQLRRVVRRGEIVLTTTKSSAIEDILALIGMNSYAFDIMNEKINGEFRNNANRAANCVTRNIDKAIIASQRQLTILKELEERGLLSTLPEELEATARLRLKHHDLSIYQLSLIAVPKISKSGLAHRLNKIIQLAEGLLAK